MNCSERAFEKYKLKKRFISMIFIILISLLFLNVVDYYVYHNYEAAKMQYQTSGMFTEDFKVGIFVLIMIIIVDLTTLMLYFFKRYKFVKKYGPVRIKK